MVIKIQEEVKKKFCSPPYLVKFKTFLRGPFMKTMNVWSHIFDSRVQVIAPSTYTTTATLRCPI